MDERLTDVQGLPQLLRAVAGRIESDINGLNKTLLLQSAEHLDRLEVVAAYAIMIIDSVSTGGDGAVRSLVPRERLVELSRVLREAGKDVRTLRV